MPSDFSLLIKLSKSVSLQSMFVSSKNQYLTVMKRNELVEVEPEILQITVKPNHETKQILKVKNITSSTISNLFFCLFNQEKFEFMPDNFSLMPNEEKLITIKLRSSNDDGMRRTSNKEFAYLKASQVNIRITMLLKYDEDEDGGSGYRYESLEGSAPLVNKLQFSKEINRASIGGRENQENRNSESPTDEEINTLSSRAYRINQSAAFEKILLEKDQYINRLQRDIMDKNDQHERFYLEHKNQSEVYENQIRQGNLKIAALEGQLRQVVKQLRLNQADLEKSRTSELTYKALYEKEKSLYTELKAQFERILSQKEIAETKYQEIQQRLAKRQDRIKELESVLNRMKDQIKSDNQRRVQSLQSKLTEQRQLYETEFSNYEQRLKQLELIAQNSQQLRNQSARFEQQLIRKQEELKHAKSQVESLRKSIRQLESQKLAKVKLEVQCSRMSETNQILMTKAQKYEEQLEKQRQQLYLYKSRVEEQPKVDTDKMSTYLEMALESCKKENQILRRGKIEMEKSLMVYSTNERLYRDKVELLEKELQRKNEFKGSMDDQQIQVQRQRAEQIVRLKEQNVLLLERFQELVTESYQRSGGSGSNQQFQQFLLQIKEKDGRIAQLEHSLQSRMTQIQTLNEKLSQKSTEISDLEKQRNRYKDDLRQDLTHINQSAMEQIRKLQAQKKKMSRRIADLEVGKDSGRDHRETKESRDCRDYKDLAASDNRLPSKSKITIDDRPHKNSYSRKSKHAATAVELTPHSDKLQGIEVQLIQMREQLQSFKQTTQQQLQNPSQNTLGHSRKTGIFNQRREIRDSRNKSQSNIVMSSGIYMDEQLHKQLAELREMEKVFQNEQRRLRSQFNIRSDQDNYPTRGVFRVIGLFKSVEDALSIWQNKIRALESQGEANNISIKIKEDARKQNDFRIANQTPSRLVATNLNLSIEEKPTKLYEYLQEQMRTQFKRLNQTIQLSHDKYDLLKRKVYNQYRSKLTDLIGKKDRTLIGRIEQLLEKFVDGLANTSHKEAVLAKQVKKKLQYKRENENLKTKISQLNCLLSDKKGICSRDTVKIHHIHKPQDQHIYQSVKIEAQLLSCQAENRRLSEQISLANQNTKTASNEMRNCIKNLQQKEEQVLRLKSQILQIDRLHKQEINSMISEMDVLRAQYLRVDQLEHQVSVLMNKEKECSELKKELARKKEVIQSFKEKERVLLDTIQGLHKEYEEDRPRVVAKQRVEDSTRMQETLAEFKQRNKELKNELQRRQESEKKLLQQLDRKTAYINSIKSTNTRPTESPATQQQQLQVVRLTSELKQVQMRLSQAKSSNTKLHSTIENLKTKLADLQKQLSSVQNELRTGTSQWSIKQRSLSSILRSIVEMMRRLWRQLEIKVKKLHPEVQTSQFDVLVKDILKIDMIRLYDGFEDLIKKAIIE